MTDYIFRPTETIDQILAVPHGRLLDETPWLGTEERQRLIDTNTPFGCRLYATNCQCDRCMDRQRVVAPADVENAQ